MRKTIDIDHVEAGPDATPAGQGGPSKANKVLWIPAKGSAPTPSVPYLPGALRGAGVVVDGRRQDW